MGLFRQKRKLAPPMMGANRLFLHVVNHQTGMAFSGTKYMLRSSITNVCPLLKGDYPECLRATADALKADLFQAPHDTTGHGGAGLAVGIGNVMKEAPTAVEHPV